MKKCGAEVKNIIQGVTGAEKSLILLKEAQKKSP